ncbi:MAG: tetratricopeptide repeat protein [Rhodospirillaceae bacterium]
MTDQMLKNLAGLKRTAAASPRSAEAHYALAKALRTAQRYEEALTAAQRAVQLKPQYAEALVLIAQLYRRKPDLDRALTFLQNAVSADARYAPAYSEFGAICLDLNRAEDAANHFREALWLDASLAEAHVGLGNALRLSGRMKEAIESLLCAERTNPKSASAQIVLGMIADAEGRLDEAIRRFDLAASSAPASAARYNRALALLRHGRFAEGWSAYEDRWSSPVFKVVRRHQQIPRWRGEEIADKQLLVWGEQGVGDEIIFSTMIPDLIERKARVILECEPRLVPLFQRTWPEVEIAAERKLESQWVTVGAPKKKPEPRDGSRPAWLKGIQFQIASGSLGEFFRPDFSSFPRRGPLLKPDLDRSARLRRDLLAVGPRNARLTVGISWLSNTPMAAAQKSTTLEAWMPILKEKNIRFVDLQYGDTAAERAELERRTGIGIAHPKDVDLTDDLDGVAALIAACDLVISVSNTTVHLAGAVGAPVWGLMPPPTVQPWYWFTNREDSPWYESARLFRPKTGETWSDVIKRAATELRAYAKR